MPAGVTAQGLEIKTVEQINAEIFNAQLSFLGADLDTDPDQPLGQLNGIVATKLAEVWEVLQTAYNAFNPAAAEGALLDVIGQLRGVPRLGATSGGVSLLVNLSIGTTLTAGVSMANVAGQPTNRWTPVANFTAPGTGNYPVNFRSVSPGNFPANTGTITEITTATAGWNSVTNLGPATTGREIETDTDYRNRQATAPSTYGSGTVGSLQADLLAISGVSQVTVFENTSDFYDSLGLPPHSFEAVVRDGSLVANDVIAQVLWDNKPAGIPTYGLNTGTATDTLGQARLVYFTRPTAKNVDLYFTAVTLPGYNPTTQNPLIQAAITAYLSGLRIGEDVVVNRIRTLIMQQANVWDVSGIALDVGTGLITTGAAPIGPRSFGQLGIYSAVYNPIPGAP